MSKSQSKSIKTPQTMVSGTVIVVLGALVVSLSAVFYCVVAYVKTYNDCKKLKNHKRVLVVIAHPDDECMFFGPTIVSLCKEGYEVFILCLSVGNYYNRGSERKEELRQSCKILGIPIGNITFIQHTRMPDNPKCMWKENLVGEIMLKYIGRLSVDTVITFDKGGVSGHYNHISIYKGLRFLLEEDLLPPDCQVFILETVNVLRKYSCWLDVPVSFLFAQHAYVSPIHDIIRTQKAMLSHKSQVLWFRRLYIIFSRYMLINTLHKVEKLYEDVKED